MRGPFARLSTRGTTATLVVALACALLLAGCLGPAVTPGETAPSPSVGGQTTPVSGSDTPATTVQAPPSPTPPAAGTRATVVEVIDGDTVKLRLANGSTETARLLGVDTPEVHVENDPAEFEGVPETEAGRACLREWGERASAHAKQTLLGEDVTIAYDANEPRRGYYGRLLVYVYHDGRAFNYGLVAQGYARMYDSNFQFRERYAAAEQAAMAAGAGLWTCRTPESTGGAGGTPTGTVTPGQAGSLAVVTVHADAEGPDGEHLNDEYVVLRNVGPERVDLSGAVLVDAAGHTYTFPDGTVLDPGETLTVHTGSGENTASDHYWGAGSPVWNNGGDTVVVRTPEGTVLVEYRYDG